MTDRQQTVAVMTLHNSPTMVLVCRPMPLQVVLFLA